MRSPEELQTSDILLMTLWTTEGRECSESISLGCFMPEDFYLLLTLRKSLFTGFAFSYFRIKLPCLNI